MITKQVYCLLVTAALALSARGADTPQTFSPAPVASQPAACQNAVLRNGFTLEHVRAEVTGETTRLWLCGAGHSYMDLESNQIASYEKETPVPIAAQTNTNGSGPSQDSINYLIATAAWRHQIDPDFIASVVKAESDFNPNAVSPKGASGLMQLMPQTAAVLGIANIFDPAANVEGGTKYLRELLDTYHGDAVRALAAYNAGPKQVEHYGGIPPFPETRTYVTRVIRDYNRKKSKR